MNLRPRLFAVFLKKTGIKGNAALDFVFSGCAMLMANLIAMVSIDGEVESDMILCWTYDATLFHTSYGVPVHSTNNILRVRFSCFLDATKLYFRKFKSIFAITKLSEKRRQGPANPLRTPR